MAAAVATSLPPNGRFDERLSSAVIALQTDFVSGARALADASLASLAELIKLASETASTGPELWAYTVRAARALSSARPAMSAAVTASIVRCLSEVNTDWKQQVFSLQEAKDSEITQKLADITSSTIEKTLDQRQKAFEKLGFAFSSYVGTNSLDESTLITGRFPILSILTLSNSSSVRTCMTYLLENSRVLRVKLFILESRPRFEGADMALRILNSLSDNTKSRLQITIAPDCAVAKVCKSIDFVLLGADRISCSGSVSNKIGSLTAATIAKTLNKKVIVASDADKIVRPDAKHEEETHAEHEIMSLWSTETREGLQNYIGQQQNPKVEIFGDWFEWVGEEDIDAYVTEFGIMGSKEIGRLSQEIGKLEDELLGKEPGKDNIKD